MCANHWSAWSPPEAAQHLQNALAAYAVPSRLEQGGNPADRKGAQHDGAVHKSQRQRDGRLTFERRVLTDCAEPSHDTGPGVLSREVAEAGHQPIERIDRLADFALRHDPFEVQRLEHLLDARHRDLHLAIKAAARREAERANRNRDHIPLLHPRPADLDAAIALLQFAKSHRPWLRREIRKSPQRGGDVSIKRLRGGWMKIGSRSRRGTQYQFNHRILKHRTGDEAAVQFEPPRVDHRNITILTGTFDSWSVNDD